MALVKTLWCVRCGQSGHVNGRGELVHDNFMVTANDHTFDSGTPTIPGTVNNFRVLGAMEVSPLDDSRPEWVVLCDRGTGHHDRYVTWRVHFDHSYQGGSYTAHGGHYLNDFRQAMNDFAERGSLLAESNSRIATLEGQMRERDDKIDELTDELNDVLADATRNDDW